MNFAVQAKTWREKAGLTVQDLADLSGYSVSSIYQFERGVDGNGVAPSEWSWQRYRMCCAAVQHQVKTGKEFAW